MANDAPEEVQRWTARRRVALVVSILKGETPVQQAARKHGLTVAEVEDWQERFIGPVLSRDGPLRRHCTLVLGCRRFRVFCVVKNGTQVQRG